LGEYLHELNKEDEESPSEVPDIPTEETDFGSTDFGSTEEEPAFGSEETNFNSEDITFDSGETTFETSDSTFGSEETNFNTEETTDFGSTDFGSTEEPSTEDPFAIEETTPFSEPEPISDPEPIYVQEPEPEPEYTPELVAKAPEHVYKSPENFEDLKKFAESTSITGMGAEGNPSFSVLLKNIRYIEDVNDILALMKELGLLSDPEEQIRQRLMRGHLLVPRISEYAAIFLAHKLRRFDIDIQVGLSDEIHPPKHQETPETGLVSKYTLYQNQTHHFHFDDPKLEISQIIVAATPNLEGHQVIRYLGVASEHKMLDGHIVEDEDSAEIPRYYSELALKLKAHALKANANAVIGLNYQLTPLPSEYGMAGSKYRLSCTGNLVWVNKL
jgi:uncharacterized protein YbjQ (UPF0145 family)